MLFLAICMRREFTAGLKPCNRCCCTIQRHIRLGPRVEVVVWRIFVPESVVPAVRYRRPGEKSFLNVSGRVSGVDGRVTGCAGDEGAGKRLRLVDLERIDGNQRVEGRNRVPIDWMLIPPKMPPLELPVPPLAPSTLPLSTPLLDGPCCTAVGIPRIKPPACARSRSASAIRCPYRASRSRLFSSASATASSNER